MARIVSDAENASPSDTEENRLKPRETSIPRRGWSGPNSMQRTGAEHRGETG